MLLTITFVLYLMGFSGFVVRIRIVRNRVRIKVIVLGSLNISTISAIRWSTYPWSNNVSWLVFVFSFVAPKHPTCKSFRPRTHGNVFLRFCIVSSNELVVLDSLENSKQYKNTGKRFHVYGASINVFDFYCIKQIDSIFCRCLFIYRCTGKRHNVIITSLIHSTLFLGNFFFAITSLNVICAFMRPFIVVS